MDSREINHKWYESFDEKQMVIHVDSEYIPSELPAIYEVCDLCLGKGCHVNSSIDRNGLSAEDFDEDPDFREDYFSGMYDVPCVECGGKRVVPAVNYEALPKDVAEKVRDFIAEYYQYQAQCWKEREMGY